LHIGKVFEAYIDNFLLHLPADKEYLAKYSSEGNFIENYKIYLYNKSKNKNRMIKKIKSIINKILRK